MKKIVTALLTVMLSTTAIAQAGKMSIKGIMKDRDGKPLEAATLTLQHMPDKKLVQVNITNAREEAISNGRERMASLVTRKI